MTNFNENESLQAEQINKFLAQFGTIHICGMSFPQFRLVWSDEQNEKRSGTYNIYYADIFVRTESGTLLVPKYPHIKSRYIIEMWYPPEVSFTPELPESRNGSYEARYVFEDKDHNRLPLRMRVVEILMQAWMRPNPSKMARASHDKQLEEAATKKSYEADIDLIDTSDVVSLLHSKEAVIVPSNFPEKSPNLRNKDGNN